MVSVENAVLAGKEEPEAVYWIRYSMMIPLWNSSGGGNHKRKTDMKDRGTAVRSSGAASGAEEGGGESWTVRAANNPLTILFCPDLW